MTLVKATLQVVAPGAKNPPELKGDPIPVQLNPTSLRYQLSNNVDMGKAAGRAASQAQGSSSATLQFDLVYDTADEGTTADPLDVRKRTRQLERFVLPDKTSAKSAPPRVKFQYGSFIVYGVMTALNQDFDLFAESGVPLRAKVSVTIKEQKPEFDAEQIGAGANLGKGAQGQPGSGRGSSGPAPTAAPGGATGPGPRPTDSTGTALAGESAADFAARMGLDPAAWTSFAGGIADTTSLPGGLRIDFSSSLTLAGLGGSSDPTASRSRALAGVGSPGASRDVSPEEATDAGGVGRALGRRAVVDAEQRVTATRAAFGVGPAPADAMSVPAAGGVTSGGTSGATPVAPASAVASATTVDLRAVSYGRGVPLRPRVGAPDGVVEPLVPRDRCTRRGAS